MSTINAASLEHHGCRLFYSLQGDGPPVLFIQGVGVHGQGWRPQVEGLAGRCRCLTFDNRGMGKSQPSQTSADPAIPFGAPITVEQMAEDALAVMDAAGWESAHVVGHSLGGLVALQLALTARRRVRSLSLLCTFADGRVATRLTPRMLWLAMRSRIGPRKWRRRAFLQIVMPQEELVRKDREALAARLADLFGHDLADHPPIVSRQLEALKHYDATPRLKDLAGIPTLIVSGTHDPIAPPAEAGEVLSQNIPGSRFIEFPHASHGLPIQCADELNTLLLEHITHTEKRCTEYSL